MRRILILATLLVLMISLLVVPAFAETGANTVSIYATVSSDGTCQVTTTVLLHLEQPMPELTFPVPLEAESITLNGSRVRGIRTDNARQVDLGGIAGKVAGEFSMTITYILRDRVVYNDIDMLELQLPLLSGFDYPIQKLEYSVTMPGPVSGKPAFSSGYHQANIEKDLSNSVTDNVFTGSSNKPLKDHETLMMTVPVTEEMFPQNRIELPDFEATNTLMWISFGLAALYWLIFLRCRLPRKVKTTAAPEGINAGQLGSVLHMRGADLTLMVFSWAQLGYLCVRKGKGGSVLLCKRMDMGNERSGFEQRCFYNLFGRRDVVDTSDLRYVELWDKTSKMNPNIQHLFNPRSGSKRIFRVIAALIGLFGGAGAGISIGAGAALQWLLVILFAVIGFVLSWYVQRWAEGLLLNHKEPLWTALVLVGVWLLLSALSGVFSIGFWMMVSQLLAGLFVAFGGRRTEAGRQVLAEILGLRRYLRKASKEDLQRICQSNPEYFFTLVPYAMALGVDKHFAKRFGKMQLPECPYLQLGNQVPMTAFGWNERIS